MKIQGARLREKSQRQTALGADEESIASEDSDIEEELGYIDPLDTVDPYVAFKRALTSMYSYCPFHRKILTPHSKRSK